MFNNRLGLDISLKTILSLTTLALNLILLTLKILTVRLS